jgi:uncharacterized membrane protein YfcA
MHWLEYTIWTLSVWEVLVLVGVGLVAGLLGGLLGIGGGIVNVPAIALLLGRDIHLAQAASMNVTIFVAIPASIRHWKLGAIRTEAVVRIVPFGVVGILLGVTASIWIPNAWLGLIFGLFLVYVFGMNLRRLLHRHGPRGDGDEGAEPCCTVRRCGVVGSLAGFGAGMLGVGGGLITVPLTQLICRMPLRQCIATSSTVMVFTALVGAAFKDITLVDVPGMAADVRWYTPMEISIWLIPTCLIGSWTGANLTHVMPLKVVRAVFLVLVAVAAIKMLT